MNKRNLTTPAKTVLSGSIGCILLACQPALAQAIDTSDWKCELCPFTGGHDANATVGATSVSDDSAYFGDATGYDEEGVYGNLDGRGSFTGDAWFLRWTAEDLLLDSRAAELSGGLPGQFDYHVGYRQLPRREYITTQSVFSASGGDLLTLPTDWVAAPLTTDFTALDSSLRHTVIESDRREFLAGGRYHISNSFNATVDYRRHENEGNRILGGSYYTTASLLPAPFDYVTDEVELSLGYAGRRLFATVAWFLSDFSSGHSGIAWESPFTSVPGAETPELAQAPDSQYQQISLTGSYTFDFLATTLSATASVGEITQDSAFLPYTTNIGLATDPLPRPNLDGQVDVSHYALSASLRPLPRARIWLTWRYDERDNRTARDNWNRVIADSFVSGDNEPNTPYSFERTVLKGRASYRLFDNLTLQGGAERREVDRDFQEVAEQTEDTGWLGIRWQPLDMLAVDARGGAAKRTIDAYDETVASAYGQNPLLRKYNLAYRYREFANINVSLSPAGWRVSLAFDGLYADDSYTESLLGITSASELQLAADLTWTMTEKTSWYLNIGFDEIESKQLGSDSFASADWQAAWQDDFVSLGTGIRFRQLTDKIDLAVDYRESDGASEIHLDSEASGDDRYPDLETRYDQLRVSLDYRWSERLLLEFGLTWQTFESDDWMLDGVSPAAIPEVLSLGAQPYDDEQLLFGIGFRYEFRPAAGSGDGG